MPMHGQLLKSATQPAPGSHPEAGIKIKNLQSGGQPTDCRLM
jgi:hypothetical protein